MWGSKGRLLQSDTINSYRMPSLDLTMRFRRACTTVFLKYLLNEQPEQCGILAQHFLHSAPILDNIVYCKVCMNKAFTLDIIGENLV